MLDFVKTTRNAILMASDSYGGGISIAFLDLDVDSILLLQPDDEVKIYRENSMEPQSSPPCWPLTFMPRPKNQYHAAAVAISA